MRESARLDEQYNVSTNQQNSRIQAIKARKLKGSRVRDALERMK